MTNATELKPWTCKCPITWYPRAEYCPYCQQKRDEVTVKQLKAQVAEPEDKTKAARLLLLSPVLPLFYFCRLAYAFIKNVLGITK